MRRGAFALGMLLALAPLAPGRAAADPYLEGSAFLGVDDFGSQIGLGGSTEPEQRPQTSPLAGARLTAMLLRTVVFDLGVEPELVFTPAWTGYGFDGPRNSYFAPVFGYRGSLILRLRAPRALRLHALAGFGGATVVSSSPYVATDTAPVLYYGVGGTLALGAGLEMRVDLRQGFMPARAGGSTAIYEGMIGIGVRFGAVPAPARPIEEPPVAVVPPPVAVVPPPVAVVTPPVAPPPEPDRDGDGIPDAKDRCPDEPEDLDHFEDEDGCPDPDNDHDGIPDAQDKCPDQPETVNGFADDDGCPDEVAPALTAAFEAASAVRFEPARVRLTDAAKASLSKALTQLHANPTLHVVVTGHVEGKGDPAKAEALAKKRAEAVKWYFVDQGVPADQIGVAVGAAAERGRVIELAVSAR